MRIPFSILSCTLAAMTLAWASDVGADTLPPAADVVALFEFDGNTLDSSGNGRHADLVGGTYVGTRYGTALRVLEPVDGQEQPPMGIDWSIHAGLLVHPYTVEILYTPVQPQDINFGYQKLFSFDDAADGGWYHLDEAFVAYPSGANLGEGAILPNQLAYLAIVSTAPDQIEVFHNGRSIGVGPKGFTGTPPEAVFFRDDSATSRGEQLNADVEVLRISDVARSAQEIATIAAGLPFFADGFETPGF